MLVASAVLEDSLQGGDIGRRGAAAAADNMGTDLDQLAHVLCEAIWIHRVDGIPCIGDGGHPCVRLDDQGDVNEFPKIAYNRA